MGRTPRPPTIIEQFNFAQNVTSMGEGVNRHLEINTTEYTNGAIAGTFASIDNTNGFHMIGKFLKVDPQ